MPGTLYLVATPIGNLGDISKRMAETLEMVDFIAAEDTRVTQKLLSHLGIRKPLVSYHRHNTDSGGARVLDRLMAGENAALVSDAGTPAISDPGEELVRDCAEAGVTVVAVPGPAALICGLALSGLPTGRFCFEGFLAMNKKNRKAHLASLQHETRTMVFYEAPHKLQATLEDLCAQFGEERKIALARELTKLHEEVFRGSLADAVARVRAVSPKGEYVLILDGATAEAPGEIDLHTQLQAVEQRLADGLSLRDAVREVSEDFGTSKKRLYDEALRRKGKRAEGGD